MRTRRYRDWRILVAFVLLTPSVAAAQTPEPRTEGFGIGVMFTAQAGAGQIVSLRVSVPTGNKAAFDFDIGYVFSNRHKLPPPVPADKRTAKPMQFRWLPGHLMAAGHVRWIPWGRHDSGWSTAIIGGARFTMGASYDADNKKIRTYWTKGIDFGVGVDRVLDGGDRVGVEGGNSVTVGKPPGNQRMLELSGPSIWAGLFGSWISR
jgi:hypothetical protein